MRGTPFERFMAKVAPQEDGCWLWTASKNWVGYGSWRVSARETTKSAHRWLYEHLVGPVPDGLHLDHLCGVRLCVNPDHLEPVTPRENLRRSPNTQASINAAKTHCKRGHEFTPENTYIYQPGDRRACATCVKAAQKARRDAKRKPTRSTCADCGASLRLVKGQDGTQYWWGSNTSMFCEARKPHVAAVDLLERAS